MKQLFALLSFIFTSLALNAQSPQLDWVFTTGGTGNDFGNAIGRDAQGNIYTAGSFSGTADFDPGPGVYNLSSLAYSDIFILKTDAAGNFIWAKSIGGSGYDEAYAMAVSPAGAIYLTGYFAHTVDFDPGPGIYSITNADDPCNTEIYVLKLDSNGDFAWARSVRGVMTVCTAATDVGYGLDIDQHENVFVTGFWTGRADFNTDTAAADTLFFQSSASTISGDIFVLKLDASGNFKWAGQIGNGLSDTGYGVHVSDSGFVFVTGLYGYDADFDPGPGHDTIVGFGNWDDFILKLDTSGNYIWAKGFGGSGDDRGFALTTDAQGNIYATGFFSATADFDPSPSVHNLSAGIGGRAIYLLKLDPAGNYLWAKAMTGNGGGEHNGTAIALDAQNNIYTTGFFTETVDFNMSTAPADTFNLTAPGAWTNTDAFIHKTDPAGNFTWAVSMGSTGVDRGNSIVLDANDNVYTTGYFAGTVDFDPRGSVVNKTSNGGNDLYIQKLSQTVSAVAEMPGASSLSVYPNPAQENVRISMRYPVSNEALVSVTDLSGRIIFTQTAAAENGMLQTDLDLQTLSPGLYFVRIGCGDATYSVKLVKE